MMTVHPRQVGVQGLQVGLGVPLEEAVLLVVVAGEVEEPREDGDESEKND
jgi:hypothetical protein